MSRPRAIDIDASWSLFLDRDGTINKRLKSYVTKWEDFDFLDKAPESLGLLADKFHKIFIVTNQQGIDKELMTHEDLQLVHSKMLEVLDYYGGRIDQIYYEPSLAAFESHRRKPSIGMGLDAQKDFPSVQFPKSIMIGDTLSDILFGQKLGMTTVWIENAMEKHDRQKILQICDYHVGGLYEFYCLLNG